MASTSSLFIFPPDVASGVMIGVGSVTAIGAALIAIAQIDVKRSLSSSVSAYMGLVFIAVGTGQDETALLLLFTYAIAMALLVMSTGGVILNCITQDLSQYGGLWSRRPISGISYLVGAASLVAFPSLGCFWTLSQMANNLWVNYPLLVGVMLIVNGLTSFSVTREFCLIFGGKSKPMTVRSPEGLWATVLPMTIGLGFALHVPILLWQWQLLPLGENLNFAVSVGLALSTFVGGIGAMVIYLNDSIAKPIQVLQPYMSRCISYCYFLFDIVNVNQNQL